jgi:thiol-disulfide isomerase/thioredoxin
MKRLNEKCGTIAKQISILYFYGQKSDCPACKDMSDVLTYLRTTYPEMRIYSFDVNTDLPALKTMQSIYAVKANQLPAIVYKDDTYVGAKTIEEMKNLIPSLKKIDTERTLEESKRTTASSSPTSTVR